MPLAAFPRLNNQIHGLNAGSHVPHLDSPPEVPPVHQPPFTSGAARPGAGARFSAVIQIEGSTLFAFIQKWRSLNTTATTEHTAEFEQRDRDQEAPLASHR